MTPNERIAAVDRWIATWLGIALLAAVGMMLSGCTGSAYLTASHDPSSNYSDGIGVRVEAMTTDTLRPVMRLAATNAHKGNAASGYTYSGSAGVRYGETFYGEAGSVWFGYRSDFGGSSWESDDSTVYGRIGYDAEQWAVAATYYAPFGGIYDTDELRLESRFYWRRLAAFVEPSFYRMMLPQLGERVSDAALRGGLGVRW